MRALSLLYCVCALMLVLGPVEAAAQVQGLHDFRLAGFPAMTFLAAFFFLVGSAYAGVKAGPSDWRGNGSALGRGFLILNTLTAIVGIFMLFGPGSPAPRINDLGFLVLFGTCIGYYAAYSNTKAVAQALFIYLSVVVLSLLGCMTLLNFTQPFYNLTIEACQQYFLEEEEINRCFDKGYLQLLRTWCMFAVFFLLLQISQLFLALSDSSQKLTASKGLLGEGNDARAPFLSVFGEQQQFAATQQYGVAAPAANQPVAQPVVHPVASAYNATGSEGASTNSYQAL